MVIVLIIAVAVTTTSVKLRMRASLRSSSRFCRSSSWRRSSVLSGIACSPPLQVSWLVVLAHAAPPVLQWQRKGCVCMDKMSESSFTALYGNLIDVSEILKSRKIQLDLPTLKLPALESLTDASFITKRIKENMPTLTSQFQIQDAIMTPAIKEALQGYSEIFKGVDFDINALLNQAETTIQQASEPFLTTADSVEIKSTLRDFEETLDRVSPQLPSDTVDAVKSSVVKPLKDKRG